MNIFIINIYIYDFLNIYIYIRSLTEYGLLSIVEEFAYHEDISIRLALISMLTNMLDHETALVRNYCINQMKKEGKPLIETIIDRFHSDSDSGIRSQYMDILRILLDTSTLDPNEVRTCIHIKGNLKINKKKIQKLKYKF